MNPGKKKNAPRSGGRTITILVLLAAIVVCVCSVYNIFTILAEDASSEEVTQTMRSYAVPAPAPAPAAPVPAVIQPEAPEVPAAAAAEPEPAVLSVDFAGLQDLNPDICAWIDIPGTPISYPVAQTGDNDYYLSHSADRTANRAGAIFLDTRVPADLSGRNTIVYGHRMNNGSMFGSLHKLAGTSYLEEHPYIHMYVPGSPEPLVYEILTTWESSADFDSPAYQVDFADEAAFADWEQALAERAGTVLAPDDRILTLSTCVRGDGGSRFIVAARLIPPVSPAA